MPSKTPAQARLMAAAAHTPGGFGGVPQSVGKEFNQADKGKGIIKPKKKRRPLSQAIHEAMAQHGMKMEG